MVAQEIEGRLRRVVEETLDVNSHGLSPETRLDEDLGADSLDVFRVVLAVEEEFGTAFPDEDVESLRTVGSLVTWVTTYATL